jgi:hypothetical protein
VGGERQPASSMSGVLCNETTFAPHLAVPPDTAARVLTHIHTHSLTHSLTFALT